MEQGNFSRGGITVRKHGRRWRFKWQGAWHSYLDANEARNALDTLLDARSRSVRHSAAAVTIRGFGDGHISVAELCDLWLEWKTGPVTDEPIRPRTQRDYRRVMDLFIRPLLGAHDAALITTADLKRDLFRICRSRTAARFARTVLQQAFRWGIEERLVARWDNPCTDIALVRRAAGDGRGRKASSITAITDDQIPTPEEIDKMLTWALENGRPTWWLWMYIAATLGLRPSEVCALRAEDFDFARGLVAIERAAPDRSDPSDWHMKTSTSPRMLAVGIEFFEDLAGRIPNIGWLFEARTRGGGRPQRTHTATPCWPPDAPNREMRNMRRALGLSELYRPYSLRHFVATRLILQGQPEIQVAKFLGTSVEMLQKVYANHLDRGAQLEIGHAVTRLF